MIDRFVAVSELERDSKIYDAFTKGNAEGRIAGLKEAAEMAMREDDLFQFKVDLDCLISALEKGEGNG